VYSQVHASQVQARLTPVCLTATDLNQDFQEALKSFPAIAADVQAEAEVRFQQVKQREQGRLSCRQPQGKQSVLGQVQVHKIAIEMALVALASVITKEDGQTANRRGVARSFFGHKTRKLVTDWRKSSATRALQFWRMVCTIARSCRSYFFVTVSLVTVWMCIFQASFARDVQAVGIAALVLESLLWAPLVCRSIASRTNLR
jgi:hypothetical protein